jgi:hypothetical protein
MLPKGHIPPSGPSGPPPLSDVGFENSNYKHLPPHISYGKYEN